MTVAFTSTPRKWLIAMGDESHEKRAIYMVTQSGTKANSDAAVAWITGLTDCYFGTCQGNVAAKPFKLTSNSAGTMTFDDGGSTSNTTFDLFAIGRL
jgi:hypothetical protein